jgi:hypothetical protein
MALACVLCTSPHSLANPLSRKQDSVSFREKPGIRDHPKQPLKPGPRALPPPLSHFVALGHAPVAPVVA